MVWKTDPGKDLIFITLPKIAIYPCGKTIGQIQKFLFLINGLLCFEFIWGKWLV
jgi:hypothetical protein